MKTLITKNKFRTNRERMNHLLSGFLFGVLIIVLILGAVGCSDDDNNNRNNARFNNGYGNYYQPGYGNWGGGGYGGGYGQIAALGNGTIEPVQIALEFQYIDNAGSVVAGGQLFVGQDLYCGYNMYIPQGEYYLEPDAPGFLQNGLVSNVRMIGEGYSGFMTINLTSASILPAYPQQYSCNGPAIFDELSGNFMIETFNRVPCLKNIYVDVLNAPNMCY